MGQIKKLQVGTTNGGIQKVETPQTLSYKGVTFDKKSLIDNYKNYLKTTAQNNVAGFSKADQFGDIDKHLNNRINTLYASKEIPENANFTTAPTDINPIMGFNKFLNPSDTSKSQQFESEAFYNFMDKSAELNKQTSIPAGTESTDKFHAFHSIKGHLLDSDFGGSEQGFNAAWNSKQLDQATKLRKVKDAIKSEITNLKTAGNKEVIGITPGVKALLDAQGDKYLQDIEGADLQGLRNITSKLGMNAEVDELLAEVPLTEEEKIAKIASDEAAANLHQANLAQHAKYVAWKESQKKLFADNAKRLTLRDQLRLRDKNAAIAKLNAIKAGKSGGASIGGVGTGPNGEWTAADYLDATALAGDVASFGGTGFAIGGGLTSTLATLGSDILRGHGVGETLGNVGMNLGFTALALIPGMASLKVASKAAKLVNKAVKAEKIAAETIKVLEVAKESGKVLNATERLAKLNAMKVLKETAKIKSEAGTAAKITSKLGGGAEKVGGLAQKGLDVLPGSRVVNKVGTAIGSALESGVGKKVGHLAQVAGVGLGVNAGYNAYQSMKDKELKDVNINDLRNVLYAGMAAKGLKGRIEKGAAHNKVAIETPTRAVEPHKVTLSNDKTLEGLNVGKEIKITDLKTSDIAIKEHFSKPIAERETILKTAVPESPEFIKATKELALLIEGEKNAKLKFTSNVAEQAKEKLGGLKEKVKKLTAGKEWKLKTEPDKGSWHSDSYQQKQIDKYKGKESITKGVTDREEKLNNAGEFKKNEMQGQNQL